MIEIFGDRHIYGANDIEYKAILREPLIEKNIKMGNLSSLALIMV